MNDDALLEHARAAGLVAADARWPDTPPTRPWPVVLLTGLGAWLAAIPLMATLLLMLSPALRDGSGALVVGLVLLVVGVALLRQQGLPLFVEQLAVPGLLAGGGCLAWGLASVLKSHPVSVFALMLAVCLLVAVLAERSWLRVLLGAGGAWLALGTLYSDAAGPWSLAFWFDVHGVLAVWLAMLVLQRSLLAGPRARWAALVEDLACGWLMSCLVMLCLLAGRTFLVGTGVPGLGGEGHAAGSLLLAATAAVVALQGWPALRRLPVLAGALLLVGLAGLMTSLGGVLLAAALLLRGRRWHQAGAAAVAAAWVIGAFYYALAWPLAQKALWLAGAGAVFLLLAALMGLRRAAAAASTAGLGYRRGAIAFVVLALAAANGLIWQKEALIRDGAPLFVALAPVDPRSLMQGDYMRLAFTLPPDVAQLPFENGRPRIVVAVDERRVARPLRVAQPGEMPGAGELLLELTPKDGRWIVVTDAWFFREGDEPRFRAARFGEFRVLPDGRALLVGLADESLRPIRPIGP